MSIRFPKDWPPLDQIYNLLENNFGACNPELIDLAIAEYFNWPLRNYTQNYYAAVSLMPSYWRLEWWETGENFRCFLRKGNQAMIGCADNPAWALCLASICARQLKRHKSSSNAYQPPSKDISKSI